MYLYPGAFNIVDNFHNRWIFKDVSCDLCKSFAGMIISWVNDQKSTDEIIKLATDFCKAEHIESDRVCDLVVPEFKVSHDDNDKMAIFS